MTPYVPHEVIVSHILPRIPIRSLRRFMCVCKAWRDTIGNDDSFQRAHLRLQNMSVLVAPMIRNSGDDRRAASRSKEVMVAGLYRWNHMSRPGAAATLVHDMTDSSYFFPSKREAHDLAHCDGLVLVPCDGDVRVLNPATRRVLPLPPSPHVVVPPDFGGHQAFGLGHDPHSNTYKVARFHYHFTDQVYYALKMEVFTIGKDKQWRETAVQPSYHIMAGRTATYFKGSLLWTVEESLFEEDPLGFIRFNLADESFSVTPPPPPPPCSPGLDYAASSLAELRGELCLCVPHQGISYVSLEMWMCSDLGFGNEPPRWDRRYCIDCVPTFRGERHFRLVAVVDDEIVFEAGSEHLVRYDSRDGELVCKGRVRMKDMGYRNLDYSSKDKNTRMVVEYIATIPYVASLVSL